ncbi:MAG: universal stress protein [Pelosinus sp.]|nr:universal stress protein [Pelosinus sp.]
MFGKILVPVDGSAAALRAVNYARGVAEKFESAVTLLHVIEHPGYLSADINKLPTSVIQDMDQNGEQILAEALEIFADFDGRVSTKLEYGHAGIKITDLSKEHSYSLIVMGRRGLSGVKQLLMGSVSNYVLHYAQCPTLIIKGEK